MALKTVVELSENQLPEEFRAYYLGSSEKKYDNYKFYLVDDDLYCRNVVNLDTEGLLVHVSDSGAFEEYFDNQGVEPLNLPSVRVNGEYLFIVANDPEDDSQIVVISPTDGVMFYIGA